jgi:hypothetical protein
MSIGSFYYDNSLYLFYNRRDDSWRISQRKHPSSSERAIEESSRRLQMRVVLIRLGVI